MAIEIFKLFGSIMVDSDKAEESIQKTESKAGKLAENLGKGIQTAAKWGAGIAAGAGAAITGVTALATKVADTMGAIDDGAKKVGTSAEEYQKWAYAAKLGGMEMSTLEKAMIKQQKAFSDAKEGSKAMSEAYQRMGIDINNIGSSGEAFDLVMSKLADMEDETTRNALANDIFGKSYAELAPILAEGSAGIEAWKNEAVELGAVMSGEAVEAGANFGDTIDRVKTAFSGIVNKIGGEVMPIISTLLTWVLDKMPQIQSVFGVVFGFIGEVASIAIGRITQFIGWITNLVEQANTEGTVINEIVNTVKDMFITAFTVIMDFFKSFFDFCKRFWDDWGDSITIYLKAVWDIFAAIFKTAFDLVMDIFKVFSALFKGDWQGLWDAVVELFTNLWNNFKKVFETYLNNFTEIFTKAVPKMVQAGKNFISGLWDGIKIIWENISGWVSDKVEWLADKLMFWKKGNDEMSESSQSTGIKTGTNGSHANGLSYVPFNGYIGELHKGEEVVSTNDKQSILDILKALTLGTQSNGQSVIEVPVYLDAQQIARAIYNPLQKESKIQGTSFAMGVL